MRPIPTLALGAIAALILTVTLVPATGQIGYLPVSCIFCGDRATSDAIANVILFLPLGAALAWWAPGGRVAWRRLGPALSLTIELAQVLVPGRDASIGDVLTNTLGTHLGWAIGQYLLSGAPRPSPRAWPLAIAGFAAVVSATLWLLEPAPTERVYFGMWTPVLRQFAWYRGRVLGATLDRDSLRTRPVDPAPVRAFVQGNRTLRVRFVAGPSTVELAPLVSVYDARNREIVLLGPDRDALVLRYRRQAAEWRLDEPDVRFEGATRDWKVRDTITLSVSRSARGACLTVGDATQCVRGHTPGTAWTLVLYPESFPAWLRTCLNLMWLAGLMMLLGWCAGTRRTAVACGAVGLAVLYLLPPLFTAAPSPPSELAAAIAGLPLGIGLRRWTARLAQPATSLASTATQRSMRS